MSFLGDLVNSIGSSKAPAPQKPITRPPIISSAAHSSPPPRTKVVPSSIPPQVTGQKRKYEESETKPSKPLERPVKPNAALGIPNKTLQKPTVVTSNGIKPSAPKVAPATTPTSSSAPAKPPSKGSYAEMMARAKEAQQVRTQNPLGTIKHQATSKEKISKLAERRRLEQEKLKSEKEKKPAKPDPATKADRKRGTSPVKKSEQAKIPRAPRPPLHAPQTSYKGTMGTSAKKPKEQRALKRNRYDDYLGTDEEEDSEMEDYGDDDGYGYGSDASSDMEAGLDDIDMEESRALRQAKEDDARELALENELKREKEEKRRKLQALANARKGR